MFLTSKAFSNGGRIPKKHTQEGQGAVKDVSPPLEWHNVPEDAVTLALIMEDPAPTESHAVDHWVHWYQIFMPSPLTSLLRFSRFSHINGLISWSSQLLNFGSWPHLSRLISFVPSTRNELIPSAVSISLLRFGIRSRPKIFSLLSWFSLIFDVSLR